MKTRRLGSVIIILVCFCGQILLQSCNKDWDPEDYIEVSLDSDHPYYHFEKGVFPKDNVPEDIDGMGITYKTWCTETPTLVGRMMDANQYSFNAVTEPPEGDYISVCFNALAINKVVAFKLTNGKYALVKISEDEYSDNGECIHKFKLQINYPAFPDYRDTTPVKIVEKDLFTDARDNHTYKTVKIGSQVWMADNLAYLPEISSNLTVSDTAKLYYVYGNDGAGGSTVPRLENLEKYGVLYNWPAAEKACPAGWHLPTDEEWNQLEEYISKENGGLIKEYNYWVDIGTLLKSQSGWPAGFGGSDKYGFSALPGGQVNCLGYYLVIGTEGNWWTAKANRETKTAITRQMNEVNLLVILEKSFSEGYSVRCVHD